MDSGQSNNKTGNNSGGNRYQSMVLPYGVYPAAQFISTQQQQQMQMMYAAVPSDGAFGHLQHGGYAPISLPMAMDPNEAYYRQQQQAVYYSQQPMYAAPNVQQAVYAAQGYPVAYANQGYAVQGQYCTMTPAVPYTPRSQPVMQQQYVSNPQMFNPPAVPLSQGLSMFEAPLPSAAYTADWVSSTSNIPQDLKDPPDAGEPGFSNGNNDSGKSGPDTSVADDLDAGASAVSGDSPIVLPSKDDDDTWPDLSVNLTDTHRDRHADYRLPRNSDADPQRSWEERIKRNSLAKERNEYRGERGGDDRPRGRSGRGGRSTADGTEGARNVRFNVSGGGGRSSVPPRNVTEGYPPCTQTAILANGATIPYDPNTPVGIQIKYAQYHQATTGTYPMPAASSMQQDDKFRASWLDVHLPIPVAPAFFLGQQQPDPMQLCTLLESMGLEFALGQNMVMRKGGPAPRRIPPRGRGRPKNIEKATISAHVDEAKEGSDEEDALTEGEKADDGLGEEVESEGEETPREEEEKTEDGETPERMPPAPKTPAEL